ncbi:SMP-30/gluconolactonase/LRE family protein [Thermithiobacillus plumbiphilus]|uniref:SMP-30/gluconolactonase/LRE family protein n=1 Tax=Thermithiobacillus plumbiphilus TaxID=1729899 RepID=A0ABU9D5H7_9PROT
MSSVEIIDPCFKSHVLGNASLERLADGFRWLEGPVWFADQQCLLFSDIPNNRIMRWTESGGVSVFRQPSGFANGHTRDRQGRLIGCSHQHRCITRTELDGRITVLADRYQGKRLNSPNDVVVKSDGSIWFSDPPYGIQTDYEGGKQDSELPPTLYRLDPDSGELSIVADDFEGPNGLCFSPDERLLYVSETGHQFSPDPLRYIRVMTVSADGKHLTQGREFHSINPGYADGFRCDQAGNIWSSAADGVHCISPAGTLIGKVHVPEPVSNLTFGGRNRSRLFLCAGQNLYAIYINCRGAAYP